MKKAKFALLVIIPLLLSSCDGSSSFVSSETQSSVFDILMSDFSIDVQANYSYSISFKLSESLNDGDKFYFSSDANYDSSDILADNKGNKLNIKLDYTSMNNDFYILLIDATYNIISRENLVIPTFNMNITSGTGDDAGSDVISFTYLENNYTPSNFFDKEGITIYRGSEARLTTASGSKVLENVTISDEFTIPESQTESYYLLTAAFGGGKGTYTSRVFKKDSDFSSESFLINSIKMDNTSSINMSLKGSILNSSVDSASLMLVNKNDPKNYIFPLAIDNSRNFTVSSDLSDLSHPLSSYDMYIAFSCGIYAPISYSFFKDSLPEKKLYEDKIYSFFNDEGNLSVVYKKTSSVNILEAKMVQDESGTFFKLNGTFNSDLFDIDPTTGEKMEVSSPALVFVSDSKNGEDNVLFDLTIIGSYFEVTADLSLVTKQGPWYSLKLFFNTNRLTDSLSEDQFTNAPTYELQLTDANNYSQSVKNQVTTNLYKFQNYEGNLKLEVKDYSASIDSWNYVVINNRMHLRLTGAFYKGESSITVYSGSGDDPHVGVVMPEEDYSFKVDIDINDIASDTIYHVHWTGKSFGDCEITNDFLDKPDSINSSEDGFIFSVKQETYLSTKYYKVYKDKDWAKTSQINLLTQSNKPYASISGYLNSALDVSDTYLQLNSLTFNGTEEVYGSNPTFSELTVNADHSFTSMIDLSSMEKGLKYQLKLVKKNGQTVSDIPLETISYCGFYTEYLPNDFGFKTLTTVNGTYRVRNFGGENSHWEICFILS